MKKDKRVEMLLRTAKAGERKPSMPSPKMFIDRKKQLRKNACRIPRKGEY